MMIKNLVLKLGNNSTENTPKYEIDFQVSIKETGLIPERNKYEKLDQTSILSIWKDLNEAVTPIKTIATNYNWSKSTLYNIRKQQQYYKTGSSKRHFAKITRNETKKLLSLIDEYINSHHIPWTVKDVCDYLHEQTSKIYPIHVVRHMMKSDLQLSFKKISSRPKTYWNEILKEARILYSIKYSQQLNLKTLLVNVDEASIGRACKIEYSWSHKGENKEWQNISVFGSLKLILAVVSNGKWFWMATHDNINSK